MGANRRTREYQNIYFETQPSHSNQNNYVPI